MKQQFDANKSLLQRLLDAGYPKEDIHHHESDLYIFKTPLTTKVLEEWCEANGWDKRLIHSQKSFVCEVFFDQVTGEPMYDVAFQYYEIEEENQ